MEFTNAELIKRVNEIHRKLEIYDLKRQGKPVTEKAINWSKGKRTVSLTEPAGLPKGKKIHIINVNTAKHYRILSENPNMLKAHEVLGSRNTNVYGPLPSDAKKALAKAAGKRPYIPSQRIHAEQLGANDGVRMGSKTGRIATSNNGCNRLCLPLLQKEFPGYQHVNPANSSLRPPADATSPFPSTKKPPPIPPSAKRPKFAPTRPIAQTQSGVIEIHSAKNPRQISGSRSTGGASRGLTPRSVSGPKVKMGAKLLRVGGKGLRGAGNLARISAISFRSVGSRVISLFVKSIRLIGISTIALIVIDIILLLESVKKNQRLQKAIDLFLKNNLAGYVSKNIKTKENQVVSLFLSQWGRPNKMFIYLSPLILVSERESKRASTYKFDISFKNENKIQDYFVTQKPLKKAEYNDLGGVTHLFFNLRFSLDIPLLTPFDGLDAYLWSLSQILQVNWERNAKFLGKNDMNAFTKIAFGLANAMATLSEDTYAGFNPTTLMFNEENAKSDRKLLIVKLEKILKSLKAPAFHLVQKRLLDSEVIVFSLTTTAIERQAYQMYGLDLPFYMAVTVSGSLYKLNDKNLGYRKIARVANLFSILNNHSRILNDRFKSITQNIGHPIPNWVYKEGIQNYSLNIKPEDLIIKKE